MHIFDGLSLIALLRMVQKYKLLRSTDTFENPLYYILKHKNKYIILN